MCKSNATSCGKSTFALPGVPLQPAWRNSLSPWSYAARVSRGVRVTVIAGGTDTNTFPAQAQDYARTLIRRGIDARFVLVGGAGRGLSGLGAATAQAVEEFAR